MIHDKITASWAVKHFRKAVQLQPFGDNVKKLCGGDAVPGVLIEMCGSDDDATRKSGFSIRIEDAVKLGKFLVAHGYETSLTTTVRIAATDVALHVSSEGDPAIVVIENEDGRFLFSDDCARQLGRTLLTLVFPDDWHFSAQELSATTVEDAVA